MSVTTIIDEENITLVQGVNGILLHKEGWMKEKKERNHCSIGVSCFIPPPITVVSIFIVKKEEKQQENAPCEH